MNEKIHWRELKIDKFLRIGFKELNETPDSVLETISTLGLPIRILERGVLKPEKSGSLLKIKKKNGSVELTLHGIDPESKKKGKDHVVIITAKNDVDMGLPVFE